MSRIKMSIYDLECLYKFLDEASALTRRCEVWLTSHGDLHVALSNGTELKVVYDTALRQYTVDHWDA